MKLNSKFTWGLAWTGLAVVLAVPSADFLTGKMGVGATPAVLTSTTDLVTPSRGGAAKPVKTSTVITTRTKTGVTITPAGSAPASETGAASPSTDPVNKLLKSGKPLPDYITESASMPAATAEAVQVAAVDPAATATPPTPFPSWARPHAVAKVVQPMTTEPVVIVDDTEVGSIDVPDQTDGAPIPSIGLPTDPRVKRLNQYLQSQGLLDGSSGGRSSALVTVTEEPSATYDPDGFYLSDGPNGENARRAARRARLEQMFGGDAVDVTDDGSLRFNLF